MLFKAHEIFREASHGSRPFFVNAVRDNATLAIFWSASGLSGWRRGVYILVFTILIGTRDGPRCVVHNIRYDQDEAAVGLGAGSLPPEVPEIPVAGFGWVKPGWAQVG